MMNRTVATDIRTAARRACVSLGMAFAWCAVTFGTGWILGLALEPGKPLFLFWAGMAYLWGLQKFMPSNNRANPASAAGAKSGEPKANVG